MSLVELMISLFLTSIILTALTHHYLSVKRHYQALQLSLEKDADLQWVIDLMRDSVHQAGFTPCLGINHLIKTSPLSSIEIKSETNQSLLINRMSPYFNVLIDSPSSTRLLTTNAIRFKANRALMIADCYHMEIVSVTDVRLTASGQLLTLKKPLTFVYQPPVYLGEWYHEQFIVKESQGLFYQRLHQDQLTSRVKSMTLRLKHDDQVQIILSLDQDFSMEFVARVRAL
jgi:hypothetical protein